jgi:hypothetical protein
VPNKVFVSLIRSVGFVCSFELVKFLRVGLSVRQKSYAKMLNVLRPVFTLKRSSRSCYKLFVSIGAYTIWRRACLCDPSAFDFAGPLSTSFNGSLRTVPFSRTFVVTCSFIVNCLFLVVTLYLFFKFIFLSNRSINEVLYTYIQDTHATHQETLP